MAGNSKTQALFLALAYVVGILIGSSNLAHADEDRVFKFEPTQPSTQTPGAGSQPFAPPPSEPGDDNVLSTGSLPSGFDTRFLAFREGEKPCGPVCVRHIMDWVMPWLRRKMKDNEKFDLWLFGNASSTLRTRPVPVSSACAANFKTIPILLNARLRLVRACEVAHVLRGLLARHGIELEIKLRAGFEDRAGVLLMLERLK